MAARLALAAIDRACSIVARAPGDSLRRLANKVAPINGIDASAAVLSVSLAGSAAERSWEGLTIVVGPGRADGS